MSIPPYMPIRIRKQSQAADQQPGDGLAPCPLGQDLDVTKRDRFELLSAYLDGEVTPEERRMVLTWINNDPKTKCLYNRLMRLRQGFREVPCSHSGDADVAVARVFQCLNYRMRMVGMAGLGVFVVGTLSILSGSMGTSQSIWRLASRVQAEYLQIALDQPAFPIPKAPTAAITIDNTVIQDKGVLPVESEL
jgi:hypothetical protein